MIFLTGDVHHTALKTFDQKFLKEPEPNLAQQWVEVVNRYSLKATLFVTGLAALESPRVFEKISTQHCLEIGGHTFDAFSNRRKHEFFNITTGSFYGPRWYQRRDVAKTIKAIKDVTGINIKSWRSHAYRSDSITCSILRDFGITHHSDKLDPDAIIEKNEGLYHIPVNTPEDHSHIIHGIRSSELLERDKIIMNKGIPGFFKLKSLPDRRGLRLAIGREYRRLRRKPPNKPPNKIWPVEKWLEEVLQTISSNLKHKGYASVVAHPACMSITDGMKTFEMLCKELVSMKTMKISEYKS